VVVRVKSDNTTTVSCLNKCFSRSPILLDIIGRIWKLTMLAGVEIRAEWIPGVENVTADWLSRWGGEDEASISFSWFNFFNDHWGPFTVDYMASAENAKVARFFSRFPSLGAEGVEALGVSWKGERAWVFPPFAIIGKVVSHARRSEVEGVMIVPFWEAQPWWPVLMEAARAWFVVPKGVRVLEEGECRWSLIFVNFSFRV